ncbi:Caffeic acid 3-O-methyltransferase, partial [Bienertia sinuspersici]
MTSPIIGSSHTETPLTTEEESSCMAMCMATWSVPSMVFKTVLELNVIHVIYAAGPKAQLSAEEIVAHLPTMNPNAAVALDRMLRLLASFTILTCTQSVQSNGSLKTVYGLGPVCQFLAKNDDVISYAAFADLMHDKVMMETWKHLKDIVLDGGNPFEKTYGMGVFDYLGTDSRFYKVFYEGMGHHSTIVMKKILDSYNGFDGVSTLVDVGGATGTDEQSLKLLENCYEALPEEGKVIICDYLVPESPQTNYQARTAFVSDAIMLTLIPGARARTKQEYEALGKEAGFEDFRVICFAFDTWIMEYLKKN